MSLELLAAIGAGVGLVTVAGAYGLERGARWLGSGAPRPETEPELVVIKPSRADAIERVAALRDLLLSEPAALDAIDKVIVPAVIAKVWK
jgi:hypothetical protein